MNGSRNAGGFKITDIALAYALLRIVVGINYFNHGFTRLGNLPGFADAMVGAMAGAWMPEVLVRITAFFVSPVELIIGLCLILGLFTRAALIAAFLLMATLMYGVTIVQNWDAASTQLLYCLVLFVLLAGVGYNSWALDNRFFALQSKSLKERLQEGVLRFTDQRSPTRKYGPAAHLRK